MDRKRDEYHNFVKQYYPTRYEDTYHDTFRQVLFKIILFYPHFNCKKYLILLLVCCQQIHIDIPRTNPLIPLFQQPLVQEVRIFSL